MWNSRLAAALVEAGYETAAGIQPLVDEATATSQSLGYLLISRGRALPSVVVGTLSQLAQLPAVDLSSFTPQPEATAAMPPEVGAEFGAMALQIDGHALVVAFSDPPEPTEVDELAGRVGFRVHPVLADPVVIAVQLGMDDTARVPAAVDGPRTASQRSRSCSRRESSLAAWTSRSPAHRRPSTLRGVGRGLRPAPDRGHARHIRLHGALRPIEGCPPLDNESIRDMIFGILPASQRERFEDEHELDTSHTIPGVGRFRVNVALQRGTITAALRSDPARDACLLQLSGFPTRSDPSPTCDVDSFSSPGRPARASRPHWPR